MRVVCTAGHVDHGKSALVEALTGTDPDRFAEERRRGLTIDLGFAHTDLTAPDGGQVTVAFVDLPGHARFIGNMLAGAGSVELALLVVAADEGWMPQTAEHVAILDLLGVRHALVAITKTDLVDAETAELGIELAREELASTSLAQAPVLPVSAATGEGIDALRDALAELVTTAPAPQDSGRPRLWIDRAFSVSGAGTVVTGTLTGGSVAVGDELAVLPDGPVARVRGLQQLGSDVERAGPGSRVALALAGVPREAVPRGRALATPGRWRPTRAADVAVRTLDDAEIGGKGAWQAHVGSAVVGARVAPLGPGPVSGEGHVRLAFDPPLPLVAGDRVVLRETGRRATLGGGVVLDADPPPTPRGRAARRARIEALDARAEALEAGDLGALLRCHVAERGAASAARALAVTGVSDEVLARLRGDDAVVALGDAVADPAALERWGAAATAALRAHHESHPVERAARKDVAGRAVQGAGCPAGLVDAALDALVRRGVLAAEGPGLRTPDHAPRLDEETAAAREALLDTLARARFSPPRLAEAARDAGASEALIRELEASGELVRIAEDLAVTSAALDDAHARLVDAYRQEGPLTAARAKEVLETSRRIALPLLETLDRLGRTRRVGDLREVREPSAP